MFPTEHESSKAALVFKPGYTFMRNMTPCLATLLMADASLRDKIGSDEAERRRRASTRNVLKGDSPLRYISARNCTCWNTLSMDAEDRAPIADITASRTTSSTQENGLPERARSHGSAIAVSAETGAGIVEWTTDLVIPLRDRCQDSGWICEWRTLARRFGCIKVL
jgi:hypothetical protein